MKFEKIMDSGNKYAPAITRENLGYNHQGTFFWVHTHYPSENGFIENPYALKSCLGLKDMITVSPIQYRMATNEEVIEEMKRTIRRDFGDLNIEISIGS